MIEQGGMASFRFGGGTSGTVLHPLVALAVLIAILLILTQPRTKAVTPFLLTYFTIPVGQVVVLGSLHFTVPQILILTVLARMAFERPGLKFNPLDKVAVLWALSTLITFVLQWQETQAVIRALGELVVNLGGYLAVRFLIPDTKTLGRAAKALAAICVIQGLCMMSELLTYHNVFGAMGANNPSVREGHVRAEGAMGTLYAGAFAGALVPVFLWLWTVRGSRLAAAAGLAGASAMVFASHASTAWLAYGGSLIGLAFWPLRKGMRFIRWGIVVILTGLHLVMHGPVWSLIEKIDLTGGSSSYHRYMLVDNCIRHFSDWWLIGYRFYGDWGFDMWDLCNQFVVAALTGGVTTLVLFIMIYSRSFGAIGTTRRQVKGQRSREWFLWCLGSSLFANVVASFGINYMYHLMMWFFVLLGGISAATFAAKEAPVHNVAEKPRGWLALEQPTSGFYGQSGLDLPD